MVLEGIAFAGGLLITAALGIPVALAATQPHIWRRTAARDRSVGRSVAPHTVQFTPLDLGPDPVQWPSERTWTNQSTIPVPEWPSMAWDDAHFGQHWKKFGAEVKDRGFHAMAARRTSEVPTAQPARAASPKQPSPRETRVQQAAAARQPARTPSHPAPKRNTPQQRKPSAPSAKAQSRVQSKAPPDEAEVEHLIATEGLAGTVQTIMSRTGWEFREAAQYLARVRRDR